MRLPSEARVERRRGGGVHLADLEPSDAGPLADLLLANRGFVQPFDPLRPESYFTEAGQRSDIERNVRERLDDSGYAFGIFLAPRRIVGRIALSSVVRGAWQNANVGYFVGEEFNGRGYATAAVAGALRHAFERLRLHRVQAAVMPANVASLHVLERNGFRREGVAERYLKINGRWEDHLIFATTAEEWASRR